ncbi:MAG: FtsW/RodA/SpoVE family cell cycle protein [Bacillota bacterium]|nr:FtsW/RodA/SpoVE family cell cycle protein [Bacillota bacterium]
MKKERFLTGYEARNRDVKRIKPEGLALPPARQVHAGLLVITLILVCFGLVMLFSASMTDGYSREGNALFYVLKQAGITTMGLIMALFVALIIPVGLFDHFWMSLLLYGATTGLLVYVKFFGLVVNGARRWVDLGIRFQPSELAKIAMVFCFAGYVSMLRRRRKAGKLQFRSPVRKFFADGWLDILLPGFALLIWIGLIAWQPHISCAVIMGFVAVVLFLTAGIRLRSWLSALTQLLVLGVVVAVAATMLMSFLPQGEFQELIEETIGGNFAHVSERLDNFINPENATSDDLYQVNQSLIAIGSGGVNGIGLGEGRQKYNYLPEAHNDYVFAIIGEELGFGGTVAVILLFLLFMLIGIGITSHAANAFSALLAGGYTMLISVQAFLNIGVATHTLPPTGISLPFFSYGGTSNMFFLLAIGFILAVSRNSQRNLVLPLNNNRPLMQDTAPNYRAGSLTGTERVP